MQEDKKGNEVFIQESLRDTEVNKGYIDQKEKKIIGQRAEPSPDQKFFDERKIYVLNLQCNKTCLRVRSKRPLGNSGRGSKHQEHDKLFYMLWRSAVSRVSYP